MVLLTGLYPQNNGSVCFNPINENIPTLASILKEKNFFTGIIGKLFHHLPDSCFNWDLKESLTIYTTPNVEKEKIINFFKIAKKQSPYFVCINIQSTHRPFKKERSEKPIDDFVSFSNLLNSANDILLELLNFIDYEEDLLVLTSDHGSSFPYLKGNCYGFSTNIPLLFLNKKIVSKIDQKI